MGFDDIGFFPPPKMSVGSHEAKSLLALIILNASPEDDVNRHDNLQTHPKLLLVFHVVNTEVFMSANLTHSAISTILL